MVMTIAKITAGDGYTYLTRHVANGDACCAALRKPVKAALEIAMGEAVKAPQPCLLRGLCGDGAGVRG
jgi:hypothetical protein